MLTSEALLSATHGVLTPNEASIPTLLALDAHGHQTKGWDT